MSSKLAPSSRHQYKYQGRVVYEWDQTYEEINIYIEIPPGVKAKDLNCNISLKHILIGIHHNPPYLDLDLGKSIKVSESFWTIEDGVLHISLQKLEPGETWASAFAGHEMDIVSTETDQKRLLLERFQEENPGFDFSDAVINGQVPNARTFMRDDRS